MKVKTHPYHFDINNIKSDSGYHIAMNRFNEILSEKIGIETSAGKNIVDKSDGEINLADFLLSNPDKNKILRDTEVIFKNVAVQGGDYTEIIDKYFYDTPMQGLGKHFQNAQKKYGVNALFLSALAGLESNRGKSPIAQNKNNLFGFKAYDENPYSFAKKFESFESGIDEVAKYLRDEYLSKSGIYFNGKSIEDINKKYATDKEWHKKIKNIIEDMLKNERE